MNTKKEVLIFLHIAKTGGSTLGNIIDRQFSQSVIFSTHGWNWQEVSLQEFKNLSQKKRDNIKYLKGHMPFGCHTFFSSPCTYITILRNPIDLVISQYYYIYHVTQDSRYSIYKDMKRKKISLEEYVNSNIDLVTNFQVRILSGEGIQIDWKPRRLNPNAFYVAKRNLQEHFKVVGITEKFDETLLILKKMFRWHNMYYIKQNVSKHRLPKDKIPKDIINIIKKNNVLDMKLYAFAKKLFNKTLRAYGPSFKADLIRFKIMNKIFTIPDHLLLMKNKIVRIIPKPIGTKLKNVTDHNILFRSK